MNNKIITTQERRSNREIYYAEQDYTTEKYVVPYVNAFKQIDSSSRVLEIGCGEGGNLKYFIDLGCEVVGIDLDDQQLNKAKEYSLKFCKSNDRVLFINQNIYDSDADKLGQFDFVMLRDVIEHIPDQEKFMLFLKKFVKPDGVIFFGFPPWQMPFGGHQQGCASVLRKVPYFHLLPAFMYKGIMKAFGESDKRIESSLEIKTTGISIEQFKRICNKQHWNILDETLYLINPNYEIKFHLKPRKQYPIVKSIPFIRNFYTTCAYYIIQTK